MGFTVQMDTRVPRVELAGVLDVHSATEFSHLMHHLSEAAGAHACYDLTQVEVRDDAGWSAVRTFERDAEEYGGQVLAPPRR